MEWAAFALAGLFFGVAIMAVWFIDGLLFRRKMQQKEEYPDA